MGKFYIRVLDTLLMDTYCIITESEIESSTALGAMKLEDFYQKIVFLGPKAFGGILNNGKVFTKVKGYSKQIGWNEFLKITMVGVRRVILVFMNEILCINSIIIVEFCNWYNFSKTCER